MPRLWKSWETVRRVIEWLGLDWFVILIGKPAFEVAPLPYPEERSEIQDKFGDLEEQEKLNDAVEYCTRLLKRENDRVDKVESKAFTLIGMTGIATAIITGFAGLLFDQGKFASIPVLIVAVVLYILVVVSLMWSIFLAVKVVAVSEEYRFAYPDPNDIFALSVDSLCHVKRERAIDLFISFVQTHRVADRKATYLSGAQTWFRNSIFLLLMLALSLAVCATFRSPSPTREVSVPTSVQGAPKRPRLAPTQFAGRAHLSEDRGQILKYNIIWECRIPVRPKSMAIPD